MKKLINTVNRTNLIAQYPFDGNGYDVNDGTKTNLTVNNATYGNSTIGYQKQIATFGATTSATRASLTGIQTICFSIIPTANTKNIFQYITTTSLVAIDGTNNITTSGLTNATVYVNGIQTTAITLNKHNFIVITHDSKDATNFNFGVSSYTGVLGDSWFYSSKISIDDINLLYKESLRKLGGGSDDILKDCVAYYVFE